MQPAAYYSPGTAQAAAGSVVTTEPSAPGYHLAPPRHEPSTGSGLSEESNDSGHLSSELCLQRHSSPPGSGLSHKSNDSGRLSSELCRQRHSSPPGPGLSDRSNDSGHRSSELWPSRFEPSPGGGRDSNARLSPGVADLWGLCGLAGISGQSSQKGNRNKRSMDWLHRRNSHRRPSSAASTGHKRPDGSALGLIRSTHPTDSETE